MMSKFNILLSVALFFALASHSYEIEYRFSVFNPCPVAEQDKAHKIEVPDDATVANLRDLIWGLKFASYPKENIEFSKMDGDFDFLPNDTVLKTIIFPGYQPGKNISKPGPTRPGTGVIGLIESSLIRSSAGPLTVNCVK